MKVLEVNTVYPNGSTGRITAQIAEYTAAQPGSQVYVVFGIGEPVHRETLTAVRIGASWERKLHGAIRKLFDAEGYGSYFATGRLIKLCKENPVDVVHLHNLHGCYIHMKRWFKYLKTAGIPVLWTLHDCWPLTGHCAHFSYCGCEKWKTQCERCPQKRQYPVCIGIGGSRRNYKLKKRLFSDIPSLTLVTPCRWLQALLPESYMRHVPSRVIYNGVDTRVFRPIASDLRSQYGLQDKRLLMSAASDWTDRKGLPELLRLAELLNDRYRLVIIGLSQEEIRKLPSTVLGIERTNSISILRAWYSAVDCFVNPTLEDTMPLVNLEALACGTPVVTFDTGGCAEAITDACGRVVEQGNVEGLAHAVTEICEGGIEYTAACLEQAEHFSAERTVRAYDALYREVCR